MFERLPRELAFERRSGIMRLTRGLIDGSEAHAIANVDFDRGPDSCVHAVRCKILQFFSIKKTSSVTYELCRRRRRSRTSSSTEARLSRKRCRDVSLCCCERFSVTYKAPKPKTNSNPMFCCRGSCFKRGMGIENIMMSVVILSAAFANQNAVLFMQCTLIPVFQKLLTGTHMKIALELPRYHK